MWHGKHNKLFSSKTLKKLSSKCFARYPSFFLIYKHHQEVNPAVSEVIKMQNFPIFVQERASRENHQDKS
jgi:hypothetical protein